MRRSYIESLLCRECGAECGKEIGTFACGVAFQKFGADAKEYFDDLNDEEKENFGKYSNHSGYRQRVKRRLGSFNLENAIAEYTELKKMKEGTENATA
jgi:hypothetical protein